MDLNPKYKGDKFLCPHCKIASQQTWFDVSSADKAAYSILSDVFYSYRTRISDYQQTTITEFIKTVKDNNTKFLSQYIPDGFSVSTCTTCSKFSLWVNKEIVYPKQTSVAPPNQDMNSKIQDLYIEASNIVVDSSKGATALLRLALQLLLKQLGKSGKNINDDIKTLVSEGLSPKIKQALDLLRVVGNNAVHPGQIDFEDDRDIALKLFHILNFIADEMITKPKEIDFLYNEVVPEETKQHIEKRDGK